MARYRTLTVLVTVLSLTGCASEPTRDVVLSNQGREAMENGETQKAEELLKEAVASNPDNPYALTNLSLIYMKQYRYALARPLCERVVQRESDYQQQSKSADEKQEMAGLVQLARDQLTLIAHEEAEEQELLALKPDTTTALDADVKTDSVALQRMPAPVPISLPHCRIQVGAFKSRTGAERMSQRLLERHAALMRDKEVLFTEVGGLTKVQVGPFQSMKEATQACRALNRAGIRCFPRQE